MLRNQQLYTPMYMLKNQHTNTLVYAKKSAYKHYSKCRKFSM